MKKKNKHWLIDSVFVFTGMCILAFAISAILKPNALVTGGITGISIILGKVLNTDYTFIYYVLSLIVLFITYLALGKKEGRKILILSVVFPLILMLFSRININLTENDMFLASVYYGIVGGFGLGLILKRGYSTGGTDSLGKIIHKKFYPFISMSLIITTMDVLIILFSILVYDVKIALYAIITQIVFLKAVEAVLFGFATKLMKLEIISEKGEDIENYIMHTINRGISKYTIVGGYTNEAKSKVVTICTPRESMLIKQYIASVDRMAFVNILPVSSVWGEGVGFIGIDEEE